MHPCLLAPLQCPDAKTVLTRLWTHENLRVFHDRLVDAEDRSLVKHALHSMLKARFDVTQAYEVGSSKLGQACHAQ